MTDSLVAILVGPPHLVRPAVGMFRYLADPPAQREMGYPLPQYPKELSLWWCTRVDAIRPELRHLPTVDVADLARRSGWDDEYTGQRGFYDTPLPEWAGVGPEP